MTNLEKAIELARKHEGLYGIRNREECSVAACQEMAEWKEQQLIEKASEWFKSNLSGKLHPELVNIYIENFKQAIKGE